MNAVLDREEKNEDEEPHRPQGAVRRADGKLLIGRVGAPPQQAATSDEFYFTVPPLALVEKTQIVTCESEIAGTMYTFYAIVTEVSRQSGKSSMSSEANEYDGDLTYQAPFKSAGFTYARASILRTEPPVLVPPREHSDVLLTGPEEARKAYDADELENPLTLGLIKNGGNELAGPGMIDLDYLLGTNGGHMNVNGAAGRGTKSSFLLFANWMLLREANKQQQERPSDLNRLRIVPIIFNVKNFDLFHIDSLSKRYNAEKHLSDWQAIGIDEPKPFQDVTFYAAQTAGQVAIATSRRSNDVIPFSWSLSDIIERGLFSYLFTEMDANDHNFGGIVLDIEGLLTHENVKQDAEVIRSLNTQNGDINNFKELIDWVDATSSSNNLRNHHPATWKKFYRRLRKIVYESGGVLRFDDQKGNPLQLVSADTTGPKVIDLSHFAGKLELQRFVIATSLRQLIEARTGTRAQQGLRYLITLDELNRFAPRGATDSITRLIELVASEMRSQGIILLGAQQQASKVSEKIIENSAIQVIGKTGAVELSNKVWQSLSASAKRKAEALAVNEKLILQDNFREPMHVRVPFPAWAMNPHESLSPTSDNGSDDDLSSMIDR